MKIEDEFVRFMKASGLDQLPPTGHQYRTCRKMFFAGALVSTQQIISSVTHKGPAESLAECMDLLKQLLKFLDELKDKPTPS